MVPGLNLTTAIKDVQAYPNPFVGLKAKASPYLPYGVLQIAPISLPSVEKKKPSKFK